ncbi:FHA domain-containing protein [Pseudomonas sp. LRP2-20]|uniref:FHA domain-containing protein n=1 Tax=Pseudomonas sp. LRP2-20 TaxID=2944234 RepID=UPI002187D4BF|nr:FHA domain-containing protein [Pseudomonas sp. LRP2-20]BDM22950.1 FHA domain-containing protein [Pseudomonas sp. LRP2-20]
MNTLTLSIINLGQLQHTDTARHQFDSEGGTIGSVGTTWLINDRERAVAPIHCEIRWIEGGFCVIDHCHGTYLNDNLDSLGPLTARRLREGDRLRIGACRLQVQLSQTEVRSLADLVSPEHSTLDQWLLDQPAQAWQPVSASSELAVEICSVFEPGMGNDPLAALDTVTRPEQENSLERLIAGERP